MSTRLFASFERTTPAAYRESGLHLLPEKLSPEAPHYLSGASSEKQDGLGCLRGVATALGIQALVLILALAIWKLH